LEGDCGPSRRATSFCFVRSGVGCPTRLQRTFTAAPISDNRCGESFCFLANPPSLKLDECSEVDVFWRSIRRLSLRKLLYGLNHNAVVPWRNAAPIENLPPGSGFPFLGRHANSVSPKSIRLARRGGLEQDSAEADRIEVGGFAQVLDRETEKSSRPMKLIEHQPVEWHPGAEMK
jgi:hypothetical protein